MLLLLFLVVAAFVLVGVVDNPNCWQVGQQSKIDGWHSICCLLWLFFSEVNPALLVS